MDNARFDLCQNKVVEPGSKYGNQMNPHNLDHECTLINVLQFQITEIIFYLYHYFVYFVSVLAQLILHSEDQSREGKFIYISLEISPCPPTQKK